MFTCRCGGLGVQRGTDVVCQTCGFVLLHIVSFPVCAATSETCDTNVIWDRVAERILRDKAHDACATSHDLTLGERENDARFLRSLKIAPLD